MPSINNLFGAPGSEADEDFEIDMDKLLEGVDQSIAASTRIDPPPSPSFVNALDPDAPQYDTPDPESPDEEPEEEPSEPPEGSGNVQQVEAESQSEGSVTSPDPLGQLFAEAAQDPAKRDRLLEALRDPKPESTPVAQLPDDFEPGSPAARLWEENQATQRRLDEIAANQRSQAEQSAKDRAIAAADAAGKEFSAKYPGLDDADITRIAQAAGNSGLAARLATGADDLKAAYLQSLESTLWTDAELRTKVLDPTVPSEPTVAEEHAQESKPRKRKLTALSSSASPVSAPAPKASPLETRADGRLTPDSRQRTVMELATKLNRENNQGGY